MQKKKVSPEMKTKQYLDCEDLLCPRLGKVGGEKQGDPGLKVS